MIAASLLLAFPWLVCADDPAAGPPSKTVLLEARGTVTALTSRAISLEISRSGGESTELLLPYNDETSIVGLKSVRELQPGSLVNLQYEQEYLEPEDQERKILGTTVRKIMLLKSASASKLATERAL